METQKTLLAAVAVLGVLAAPSRTLAQEKPLSLELNDAVDLNGGCRLSYVAINNTGAVLDKASFDVFTFDAKGKVGQSLVFEFGRLTPGKTKVVQFDLAGQACADISRLLVNDSAECVADGKESTLCLDVLKTTTRTPIAFGL